MLAKRVAKQFKFARCAVTLHQDCLVILHVVLLHPWETVEMPLTMQVYTGMTEDLPIMGILEQVGLDPGTLHRERWLMSVPAVTTHLTWAVCSASRGYRDLVQPIPLQAHESSCLLFISPAMMPFKPHEPGVPHEAHCCWATSDKKVLDVPKYDC